MKIISLLVLLLAVSFPAFSDVVKIETNEWSDKRTMVWTGTLQKIDLESQIAYFRFRNRSQLEKFQVHVTRIYSLTLDNQDRIDRPFPVTRQDLKTALPTNPRSVGILELTNESFVADDIPNEVRIRPDRKSPVIYLSGTIKHADLQKLMIEAKAEGRKTSKFEISRSDLLKWIRGR
jgi:hypothetical protein